MGSFYENRGRLDDAITNYIEAVKNKPNTPEYLFNLGNVYLKKGEFEKAKEYFETALSIDPNFADCFNNLACAYLEEGKDLGKAYELAKKAIAINPKSQTYYLDTLGLILARQEIFDEAIAAYKTAIEKAPKDDRANLSIIYYHLALAQYKNGLVEDTKTSLEESLKIAPRGPMSVEAKLLLEKIKKSEEQKP